MTYDEAIAKATAAANTAVSTWCARCFGTTSTTPGGACCTCSHPK